MSEAPKPSPFTKPGFLAAAIVVAVVLVLGVGVVVGSGLDDDQTVAPPPANPSQANPSPPPSGAPSSPQSAAPSEATGDEGSICGISAPLTENDTLSKAPEPDEWAFHDRISYPSSKKYGPAAAKDAEDFRYCFQHSPEGAVYTATYLLARGSAEGFSWVEYYAAPGQFQDQLIAETKAEPGGSSDASVRIEGFRLLEYTPGSATVDVAVTTSSQGQTLLASGTYRLVWSGGDWKIDTTVTPDESFRFGTLPDLTGYLRWSQ